MAALIYNGAMPRTARIAPGGYVFHVINRGVGRMTLFESDGDYAAFERVLAEVQRIIPIRLCGYCLMPNHWHLALWPDCDGQLGRFMQRLTLTHSRRWQEHRRLAGTGHVYQGRYKSFPVQNDTHYLTLMRYIESNAKRAKLCRAAEHWPWGSLWLRAHQQAEPSPHTAERDWPVLDPGPVALPRNWSWRVNQPVNDTETTRLRESLERGRPYGNENWVRRTTARLSLENTFRPSGRPRKTKPQK